MWVPIAMFSWEDLRRVLSTWPGLEVYEIDDTAPGRVDVLVVLAAAGFSFADLEDRLERIRPVGVLIRLLWARCPEPVTLERTGLSDEELSRQLLKLRGG